VGKFSHVGFDGTDGGVVTVADKRRVTRWTPPEDNGSGSSVDLGRLDVDVEAIALAPHGRLLAIGIKDAVHLWDITGEAPKRIVLPHTKEGTVDLLRFSPAGDALISGSRFSHVGAHWTLPPDGGPAKRRAFYWTGDRQRPPGSLTETETEFDIVDLLIGDLTYCGPNARYVAATDVFRNHVRLWDITGDGPLAQPLRCDSLGNEGGSIGNGRICVSRDGRWMVLQGVRSGHFFVYDLQRPSQGHLRLQIGDGGTTTVSQFAFCPNGTWLAAGCSDDVVRLYPIDARSGGKISPGRVHTLRGHLSGVRALAFAPDGQHLASLGGDGTAFLWDLTAADQNRWTSVVLRDAGPAQDLQFTSDGRLLAVFGDGAIEFHNVSPDTLIQRALRVSGRSLTMEELATYEVPAR